MKAIIENAVTYLNDDEKNHNMLCEFNEIIKVVNNSENKLGLSNRFVTKYLRYFNYEIGLNYMKVYQKSVRTLKNNEVIVDPKKRIILVEF